MIENFYIDRTSYELEKVSINERMLIKSDIPLKIEKFYEEVLFFINTLEREKNINLNILYTNLRTLSIKSDDSLYKKKALGSYDPIKNQINLLVTDFSFDTLYHELFHCSSSFCLSDKNLIFSGFSQVFKKKNVFKVIGFFLTEGYTQLLCERYFPKLFNTSFYNEGKNLAWAIEQIVGVDNMYNYYFNADLTSLIHDLLQFMDETDLLLFLTSNVNNGKNRINKRILLKAYIKKLQNDLFNALITMDEFVERMALYFYQLGYKEVDKKCKKLLNDELIIKVTNQYNELIINKRNERIKLLHNYF